MQRVAGRRIPRWLEVTPVRVGAVEARGPALRGPTGRLARAVVTRPALAPIGPDQTAIGRAASSAS